MSLARGTVVLVDLEPTRGHEQQGTRPCVVVSDAAVNSNQRFPLIAVVPVTGTPAPGALYPALAPGASGLSKPSTALVDQVRSIDKQRIRRRYGQVSAAELEAIDNGLCLYLGLDPDP
ncbi:PemK-like protein [Cyanobium sp. PCC 7001]|uniref:type II toxin-antitoxin system PemK/MazF family toxin n=1 Tax=Cyanobium sp. PCC 7001 TaxID=180281 RepID=UPI0001805420|nr:type II toxin-antitoxin system PemK/MazF family toxin [Cyanobium sp. PCC 7001]EDY38271.1 PemK-like protein [Cyanobium sp. PCC 7001]